VVADLRDLTNRQSMGSAGVMGSSNFAPPFLTLPTVVPIGQTHTTFFAAGRMGCWDHIAQPERQRSMINRNAALNRGKLLL
jgi:hypothetical protein